MGESGNQYVSMPLIKPDSLTKREYQEEIFKTCRDANSLVVVPTGLGKTVIAAMVSAHRLLTHPTSKVVFLAPTKPLVRQHKETFLHILDLDYEDMRVLTGEVKPKERESLWHRGKVIFATPQVISRDLSRSRYNLRNVSLVVFDEAHRAIGNYPYVKICQDYFQQATAPQTIGLTASPGWEQDEISEIKNNLKIEKIEVRTETSADVARFVQPLEIQWIRVQLGTEFMRLRNLIDEMTDERFKALMEYGFVDEEDAYRKSRRTMIELQKRLGEQTRRGPNRTPMASYKGMTLTAQLIRLSYSQELLNTQGLLALSNYLERLALESESPRSSNALRELTSDARFIVLSNKVRKLLRSHVKHPKLVELVRILKEEIRSKPTSRILVFAQFRDTVKQIVEELRSQIISASAFIGQRKGRGFIGMTQVKQRKALKDFREGLYSTLVATSVAEEGLDIAECDLVVLYDAVPSEVRYIQRRGRVSRHHKGKVVTLITAETQDERYYLSAISKEKKMRDIISRIKEVETIRIEDFVFGSTEEGKGGLRSQEGETVEPNVEKCAGDLSNGCSNSIFVKSMSTIETPRRIVIDRSLENSTLPVRLRERGLDFAMRTTRGADLIIGDDIGIIYAKHSTGAQTAGIQELLSKRIKVLKETYAIPLVVFEGSSVDRHEEDRVSGDALYTMIAYFIVAKGVHIVMVRNEDEASILIANIARVSPT